MKVYDLAERFTGRGEVSGFEFKRVFTSQERYIYEVHAPDRVEPHYEVFNRKTVPMCIDFENREYSSTELKEVYPKAKDFGVWAWTYSSYKVAHAKAIEL